MFKPRCLAATLALTALVACWPPSWAAGAPSPPATPLTLQEALRRVDELGPQAALADAAIRSADAGIGIARKLPNPALSIEAENFGGTGIYSGGQARETTTSLALPLELGGKRAARVRVAEAEQTVAVLGADQTRAEAVFQVTETFVEAVASARRVELARERLRLAETGLHAARTRVRNGKASPIEEQRADVVRLNASVALEQAQRSADLARTTLARITGISDAAPQAPWFDALDAEAAVGQGTPPILALADAEVVASGARLDAAQRARVPDLTLTAGVRRFAAVDDRATVVGIALPFPVFNSGRAAVAKARADVDMTEARQRAAVLDFERTVGAAQADLANARSAAQTTSGPALAAAQEAARIARIGYDAGKFSQLELIDAERVLAETRDATVQALAALHIARARLIRLHGSVEPIFKD